MIRIILEAGMPGRFPDIMRRSEKFRTGERVNITRFPDDWNLALAYVVTSHDPTNHTFRGQLATAVRGQMLLVRLNSEGLSIDCEAVGAEAQGLALDACRSATASISDFEDKFNNMTPVLEITPRPHLTARRAARRHPHHFYVRPLRNGFRSRCRAAPPPLSLRRRARLEPAVRA